MAAVEVKLGVGRATSTLAVAAVIVAVAVLAPLVGSLASWMSLRTLMIVGSLLGVTGFAILAVASTVQNYLLAYGVFVGPAACLCGTVLPSTIATRWFSANRGRTLGLVYLPILPIVVPVGLAFVLRTYGLASVYVVLSAMMVANDFAQMFLVDGPPEQAAGETALAGATGLTERQLLGSPHFWAMAVAFSALVAGTMMLSAHLVPMEVGRDVDPTRSASLLTVMSLASVMGPLGVGWLADRLGGRLTLVIFCLDCAVMWAGLETQPSFAVVAVLILLFGAHSAGAVPTFGLAPPSNSGAPAFRAHLGCATWRLCLSRCWRCRSRA